MWLSRCGRDRRLCWLGGLSQRLQHCIQVCALLELNLYAIALQVEERQVVVVHQLDDLLDFFDFQSGLVWFGLTNTNWNGRTESGSS